MIWEAGEKHTDSLGAAARHKNRVPEWDGNAAVTPC